MPGAPLGEPVPGVRRIAVLRANGLGDLVLSLPALAALRAAYPAAELVLLGLPWHAALLDGRPGPVDRVVATPRYGGLRVGDDASRDSPELRAFFAAARAERYDLAVQLHGGGGNANPFVASLGARVTVGARDVGAPPLDRWVPYAHGQHEVLRQLEVVGLAGAPPVSLLPRLEVVPGDLAAADAVLDRGPVVALHPGAMDPRRRWPAASFAAVATALAAEGAQVVVVGSGADDAAAAAAIARRAPVLDLVGRLDLRGTTGVLARAALVVANDSGPRHLAEAVGTPTVGVFWAANALTAGPLSRVRHRVLVSYRDRCPVCGLVQVERACPHDASFVADVPVEQVLAAARDLLDRPAAAAA